MVNLLGLLPLVVTLVVVSLVVLVDRLNLAVLADYNVDAWLTRVSRRYFGRYVSDNPDRRQRLHEAYVDETYRSYAAKSYVLGVLGAVLGAVVGVYVVGGILLTLPTIGEFIDQLPNTMAAALGRPELEPTLSTQQVLLVLGAGGAVSGVIVGVLVYWLRWELPRSNAEVRRRGINEGLPRTVAFIYALSRGGMEIPEVLRTLVRNQAVYGEGAREISVAVREMDLFGTDIISAIRLVSKRTPSDQFRTFGENLGSVLQSGQSLSTFLRDQYERYEQEAADRQAEVLELLSTIAEAYVTVLVAGTLFLMTILMVFGLTTSPTLGFLRMMAYTLIPLANVMFIVYLSGKLDLLGISRGTDVGMLRESLSDSHHIPDSAISVTDGGLGRFEDSRRQLERYDSIREVRRWLSDPLDTVLSAPTRILYVTVPVALIFVAVRLPSVFTEAGFTLRIFDDILVQATLFVVGSFAVVWEIYSRRIARIEAAMPELLERLASLNEAGMSIVESFDRVREGDLGVLSPEVERIWRDIQYGANVDDALRRFGLRVRTTTSTRTVTLLTNALTASGSLGPILSIAADQTQAEIRLRQQRRQEMFTYLVVIYLAFMVFLVIILAIQEVLVPSLPSNVPTPTAEQTSRLAVDPSQFSRFGRVNKAAYTLVFFHTAMVQAVMSGFIAGQLGEGSIKDGAKHAAIMLAVAYVAFLFLSAPTAQITFEDQTVEGSAVVIDSVSLTDGGFVVLRAGGPDGAVVGYSEYLPPGTHENVTITSERSLSRQQQLHAIPYLDTDGDETYDAGEGADEQYPSGESAPGDSATVQSSPPSLSPPHVSPEPAPPVRTRVASAPTVAVSPRGW